MAQGVTQSKLTCSSRSASLQICRHTGMDRLQSGLLLRKGVLWLRSGISICLMQTVTCMLCLTESLR